jgi:hypothetical protein
MRVRVTLLARLQPGRRAGDALGAGLFARDAVADGGEPAEVAVERHDVRAVLDRKRCEVRVGRPIAGDAGLPPRTNASSAIRASPTPSAPASDASSHDLDRS